MRFWRRSPKFFVTFSNISTGTDTISLLIDSCKSESVWGLLTFTFDFEYLYREKLRWVASGEPDGREITSFRETERLGKLNGWILNILLEPAIFRVHFVFL